MLMPVNPPTCVKVEDSQNAVGALTELVAAETPPPCDFADSPSRPVLATASAPTTSANAAIPILNCLSKTDYYYGYDIKNS